MIKKSLLTLFLFARILKCAVTIIPKFEEEIATTQSLSVCNGFEGDDQVSTLAAYRRSFRAYSDVDFNERGAFKNKTKFEDVEYENFFEFLRLKIIESDLIFIEKLENLILNNQLNFPILKLWSMLEKLMREPSISNSEALIEYIFLVIKLSINSSDSIIFKPALESLKHAIRSHKPPIILKTLMNFLRPQLNREESLKIFKIIYSSMSNEIPKPGRLPKDFSSLIVALEELDPIDWFEYMYNEGLDEHDFPSYVLLSPFYFLLSNADSEALCGLVMDILDNSLFGPSIESMELISKFIKLTDFCTRPIGDEESLKRKCEIFKFILMKFDIEAVNYENEFILSVSRNHSSLVEAFLIYTKILLEDSKTPPFSILNVIYPSTNEMAVLFMTYRPVYADHLITVWENLPCHLKIKFSSVRVEIMIDLLKLSNDFDSDFTNVTKSINEDGFIIHPFPEPEKYEIIAKSNASVILKYYWIARIILSKYFGIAFSSTRIKYDYDSRPIWSEVAGAVNYFLLLRKSKYRVYFKE